MNANSAPKPRVMPIKNLAKNGPVGVLKRFCTTVGARIRALTASPPIKPTSTCCHSAWQPNLGRGSTHRRGKSVQTIGTTSSIGFGSRKRQSSPPPILSNCRSTATSNSGRVPVCACGEVSMAGRRVRLRTRFQRIAGGELRMRCVRRMHGPTAPPIGKSLKFCCPLTAFPSRIGERTRCGIRSNAWSRLDSLWCRAATALC